MNLFIAADKYDLPRLLRLVAENFIERIDELWATPQFLDTIRAIYEECPENVHTKNMRDAVISVCVQNEKTLTSHPFRAGFAALGKDVFLFGKEYQEASVNKNLREETAKYEAEHAKATRVNEQAMEDAEEENWRRVRLEHQLKVEREAEEFEGKSARRLRLERKISRYRSDRVEEMWRE